MATKRKKAARKKAASAPAATAAAEAPARAPRQLQHFVSDKVPTLRMTVEDALKHCVIVAREAMTSGVVNRERVAPTVLALEIIDGNAKPAPPEPPKAG